MEQKRCNRCQVTKPLNEFHWDSHSSDGHRGICADCWSPGRTPGPVNARRTHIELSEELASGIRICRICQVPKALLTDFYISQRQSGPLHYSTDCKACRLSGRTRPGPKIRLLHTSDHTQRRESLLRKKRHDGRARIWYQKLTVIKHYGPACDCCGETDAHFLQVDHVNGGGGRHRRSLAKHAGCHFYDWLIKQGFPKGYRILCANCNCALGYYGFCPHQGIGKQISLL